VRGRLSALLALAVAVSCVAATLVVHPASARPSSTQLQITDLGTLRGGTYSHAFGINERGQVVGRADTASGEEHAFLWEDGEMTDLGTLVSDQSYDLDQSLAQSINDRGQVAGWSSTASGHSHAVLWGKRAAHQRRSSATGG
jgi:probable HAF family extracellular repeat protein